MTNFVRLSICAILMLTLTVPAVAFHDLGVGACSGCHTMHNNSSNPAMMLLRTPDITALCLSCHATDFGNVLGDNPLLPPPERGAGNFVFLLEDNINDAPDGATSPIPGHAAGHSVLSIAYGLDADPVHSNAPGGSYPSDLLTCTSCHDPHGNQAYRMLRDVGSEFRTGFVFTSRPPSGDGLDIISGIETRSSHSAYLDGWSGWCANCHPRFHREGPIPAFAHPVNRALGAEYSDSYNAYDGPRNPEGGSVATAYLPEVPFQDATARVTSTSGPQASSRITCMTCHRAHATSAPDALRWDPNVATLDLDGLVSGSYAIPDPYNDPDQRALCVKCHYQASTDHGQGQACMDCHRDLND